MSSVRIQPKNLNGTVEVPPSKSYLHRAIICGTLSGKSIKISPVIYSDDVLATINSMKCLGADIDIFENSITTDKLDKYFDKNIKIVLYFERKKENY